MKFLVDQKAFYIKQFGFRQKNFTSRAISRLIEKLKNVLIVIKLHVEFLQIFKKRLILLLHPIAG